MSTIDQRAKTPLLILRVTLGLFLLQWGIEKFIMPDTSAMIFAGFYGIDGLSHTIAYVLGGLQCAVAVAVIAGFQKRISYLLAFLIHSVSTLSTIPNMLDPYSSGNHLFFTGVPVLAAMGLLWYLRDYDTKLSIDSMRKG
jgi:putative oxidoreductase